jgi:hypothetical protein
MSDSIAITKVNPDRFGVFLQNLAGLFIGLGLGLTVAYRFPPKSLLMSTVAVLFGLALNWLALYRTKTASQNRVELQTK